MKILLEFKFIYSFAWKMSDLAPCMQPPAAKLEKITSFASQLTGLSVLDFSSRSEKDQNQLV